ncbi:MAG TPA: hypothetical protein DCO83_14690 [Mucilaginibacter sp.]|nr:hypothetical protein [Mucilaginibacter sp.]
MRKLPIYAVALLFCLHLRAQVMPFKNYGIKDGLNDNNVQAVIRDNNGLLWLGTDFGVNWFDGKRFYQPQIKTNIGQFYVNGFYKDRSGTIWILTYFNGIYKYKDGRFTNYLVDTLLKDATINTVSDMMQVSNKKYVVIAHGCAYLFDGQKFSIFDPKNTVLKTNTNNAAQLPDETIVLSTDTGLFLYHFDKGKIKCSGHILNTLQTTQVLTTEKQLWVLTGNGVSSFDDTGNGLFSKTPKTYLPGKKIRNVAADKNGTIWGLIDNGTMWALSDTVFKIKNGEITQYTSRNGLPENIQQIYCDNEGLVWFANRKGVSLLGDEYYDFDAVKFGRTDEPVASLVNDPQNNIWLGTVYGLALKKNNRYFFYRNIGKQVIGYVSWLHKNKNGSVYAGTPIGILNINGASIRKLFNISSTAIGAGSEHQQWYGDINGDIWIDKGNSLRHVNIDHPINEMIMAIHAENKQLWVGYRDRGVVKYRIGRDSLFSIKEYGVKTGYRDFRIRSFAIDKKGNIIWGTRTNGAFVFSIAKDKEIAHLSSQNGLSANWVKDIYCDTDGKLYMATNNGVNIVSGDYKKPSIKQLKINNEAINRETNCIQKTGDVFYIGTNEGLLKWTPGNMHKDTVLPQIYFTHIDIQGQKTFSVAPYTANPGKISLPYDQHAISFEFAGISLKNPDNVRYHYILIGQDNEWGPVTEHNFVAYNLKPGNYTFKVAAENADGLWSRRPAVFHFIIKNPFWLTWWFILLVSLLIIWAAYSAYRYRLSKVLALEFLRNKISTDLHDDIGSTLSSISILSEVAIREKEQKSKRMLGEINERSHQLMEKMDDIVWSISSKNDTVGNLFVRIQQFASTVLEAKDIDYEVRVPEGVKEIKLDMQRRQHIYLILKEAINNLIKYSGCKMACINADYAGGLLNIEIADNGRGFDTKTASSGNGLQNMQKRADAIRGHLLIASAPGSGTRIILSVEIE